MSDTVPDRTPGPPASQRPEERRGYGKGCPWTCQYRQPIVYRADDYPQAVAAIDSLIPLAGLTPPNDETTMAGYVRAFEKVFAQLPRLLA